MANGSKSFVGSKKYKEMEQKTVLSVEQTRNGELAKRLREALRGMEHTLGFRVKVVERTGRSLGSKFPLNNLWVGAKCGREEGPPPCTKNNLVYENICTGCNKGATASSREQ